MTPQQTVETFIAHMSAVELEQGLALLAEDIVYDNVPMPTIRGREATRAFFAQMPQEAAEWIVHRIAANGQTVLTERTDRFRVGGKWIEIRVMGAFEVVDGQITEWRDYFDLGQFMAQMAPPA